MRGPRRTKFTSLDTTITSLRDSPGDYSTAAHVLNIEIADGRLAGRCRPLRLGPGTSTGNVPNRDDGSDPLSALPPAVVPEMSVHLFA